MKTQRTVTTTTVTNYEMTAEELEIELLSTLSRRLPADMDGATGELRWDVSSGGYLRGASITFTARKSGPG